MKRFRSVVLLTVVSTCAVAIVSALPTNSQEKPVAYTAIPGGEYKLDPAHSVIGFSIRHYEISLVRGRFRDFTGTVHYDEADVTKSSVEFIAKVESVDTGVVNRDNHLRTADFFDVVKYPEITFKSTRVEQKGKDQYLLHGDFTLKGVTKQITLPFTMTGAVKDPRGNTRFGVAAQTTVDRRDYGITWGKPMEIGGLDVGNEVMIDMQLEAVKAAPKPAT